MKTIFISCFHPYTFRNLLATDALKKIIEKPEIRVVIFVFAYKKDYFRKLFDDFNSPNIIIEGVDFNAPSSKFITLLMKRIAKYGLATNSTSIEKRMKWHLESKFFYFLSISLLGVLMTKIPLLSPILRRLMRFFDYCFAEKDRYRPYFEKYHPDLAVVADIQNERDVELVHNARNFKVPVVGIVRSWDNLTLHGFIRALPDRLLVSGQKVKEQAIFYNDVDPVDIKIVGIAHYDKYFLGPKIKKEEFFRQLKLDDSKITIFDAPIGDFYIPNNDTDSFIIDVLSRVNAQIIVRFSPTLSVKNLENAQPYPNMIFDRPGIAFDNKGIGGRELTDEDDDRLLNSIFFSNLTICGPSSIALDATFIDKPVILINFHPTKREYLQSISRRYDYDHFQFLIKCGAAKIARSQEELLRYIQIYAKNPSEDAEGRARLQEAYCGPRDGKSGQRIAAAILEMLKD